MGAELRAGGDDLAAWVAARDATFFLPPDDDVVRSLRAVSGWAPACGLYTPGAIADFLGKADYYLVAHAHAHGFTMVTHERPADTERKIKIPNACAGMAVDCVTPWQMLRDAGAKFVQA